jgi:ribosomal protein S6
MSEETMPVAEAAMGNERDAVAYELAFHVLPTVTEGEVAQVFERIKNLINKTCGSILSEEAPERFDLA